LAVGDHRCGAGAEPGRRGDPERPGSLRFDIIRAGVFGPCVLCIYIEKRGNVYGDI
jgi:hypothetical protein